MRSLFTLIFVSIVCSLGAQQASVSKKIEDIVSQLPANCISEKDTIILCPKISSTKSIVIRHNGKQQICHLGISLFSPETKEMINLPVCNFIERFFLELVLTNDKNSIKEILRRNKIKLQRNDLDFGHQRFLSVKSVLNEIKAPVHFILNYDSMIYTAIWKYENNNQLQLSFPANRELILGTNKKEADEILGTELRSNQYKTTEAGNVINTVLYTDLYRTSDSLVFIKKGTSFLLPIINSNIYYHESESGYKLIDDARFPFESLSNRFLGIFSNADTKLHIKHRMYGDFSPEFEMKLIDFVSFFKKDFELYTAIDKSDSEKIQLTVILHNKPFNYLNMLLIQTTKEAIFEKEGIIQADFYSNIPQHNIKSLFGEMLNE